MYKIIGADGNEYGPVTAEQLRQWMQEGRVNGQTLAQADGGIDWKTVASFPELGGVPPVALPPLVAPKTNGMAITGFVSGLISLMFGWLCCWPVMAGLGIVFSSIAISQINRDSTKQTGKSLAVVGLVLSILGLLVGFGILFFWMVVRPHQGFHPRWYF